MLFFFAGNLGRGFDFLDAIIGLCMLAIIAFVVFPARGFAQAYVADKLGDPTAKYNGRLTFHPLAHSDVFGLIVLFVVGLGFVKPVPINPRNFKKPRTGLIMTMLAGPVMGILMGALSVGIFKICSFFITDIAVLTKMSYIMIGMFASLNVSLAVLTLLPLPFFDGYRILEFFLPSKWVYMIQQYSSQASLVTLVLIVSGLLNTPISFVTNLIMNGLYFVFRL